MKGRYLGHWSWIVLFVAYMPCADKDSKGSCKKKFFFVEPVPRPFPFFSEPMDQTEELVGL
jgi:hypothetical protein